MRIVVLSDTHAHVYTNLPEILRNEINQADAVIHAGDIGTFEFYQELEQNSKKLYAVQGNNDMFDLPLELIIELGGVKIAVTHGDMAKGNRENFLLYHFSQENPNIIIFGHSHKPLWVQVGGQTLLNPGSPLRNRGVTHNTFVILTINDGNFEVEFRQC